MGEKRTTTTTSKDKMKLFVGNLGDDGSITSGDLRPLFEQYGTVTECAKNKTTTYAFVHMEEESAAIEAVNNLNGRSVKGRPIKVDFSIKPGFSNNTRGV